MTRLYASSPEAHPADQARIGSSGRLPESRRGRISSASDSQAGGSRKNPVALIRVVSKSERNSSGWTSR